MFLRNRITPALPAVAVAVLIGGGLANSGFVTSATGRADLRTHAAVVPATTTIAGLTLRQLAGQRIVFSYAGLTPPRALFALVRAGEAAGVIFFDRNIESAQQLRGVIDSLQAAAASSPVHAPLLMMTDQEGGLVRRLPGAPELSEKQIGAAANGDTLAAQEGAAAGENLRAAGINVDLAPVLDVFREPDNFIDEYERSYSSNPVTAADLGASFIGALQGTGVAATAKHFPGLGAAGVSQDTDAEPVTLDLPLTQLRSIDELPYTRAIAGGVKLIMLSWAVYPALDPRLPAGLSPTIVDGELRGRLGFHGVTITDSIGAGALGAFGNSAQRGLLAAQAGDDLILCDDGLGEGIDVLDAFDAALRDGALNGDAARSAASVVVALRATFDVRLVHETRRRPHWANVLGAAR
jgi:beta-N-acetylhexosaminidase